MTITEISTNTQAILVDTGLFVDVQSAPQEGETLQFSGYPSAFHYYETTDSNPATITQHRRAINYTVQAVLVVPDTVSATDEFAKAYALIDSLIQKFDESQDLSIGALPRACDILRPVPGELQRVTTNQGEGLLMTIRLTCEADVRNRSA